MVVPVIVATGLSTLAYAAVFLLLGYLTRWSVLIGAGFLFFWETGIANAADSLANISLFRIGLTAFVGMVPDSPRTLDDALGALRPGAGGALLKCLVIAAVVGGRHLVADAPPRPHLTPVRLETRPGYACGATNNRRKRGLEVPRGHRRESRRSR